MFALRAVLICLICLAPQLAMAQQGDMIELFGALVQSGIAAATQAEWQKLSYAEMACVDGALRQRGSSLNEMIRQGIQPSDPRMARLRSGCRGQANAPMPESVPAAETPFAPTAVAQTDMPESSYVVDGLHLGGRVVFGSAAYLAYRCTPSEQFAGMTWCQRMRQETSPRGAYNSTNTILHAADGTALYINRYLEPAFFAGTEAMDDVRRLAIKHGQPRFITPPAVPNAPHMLMASWGAVVLQPLDSARMADLAAGRDVHAGILLDHIGNFQRSALMGLPVYRVIGGPGYVWAASWDQAGRGTLRFLTIDASRLTPSFPAPAPSIPQPEEEEMLSTSPADLPDAASTNNVPMVAPAVTDPPQA